MRRQRKEKRTGSNRQGTGAEPDPGAEHGLDFTRRFEQPVVEQLVGLPNYRSIHNETDVHSDEEK